MEPMLTVEEVARILNVSEASIRRWLRKGTLAGVQAGDQWRVSREDLEEYIRRHRNVPTEHKNEKS